jgi:protein TonB
MSDLTGNHVRTGESLIVLTRDDSLMQTLQAVAPEHALSMVADESELSARLLDGPIGVAILDAAALTSAIATLAERLRAQFPDLVLVVAGGSEDQAAVAPLVTNGTVYRFLHKPLSAQRVKLFVDAAWRRHDVEHAATGNFPKNLHLSPPEAALSRTVLLVGGILLLIVVVSGSLWLALRSGGTTASRAEPAASPAQRGADTIEADLLARADAALARGDLAAPAGDNASDLYRQALQHDSVNARARAGLERVTDRLLDAAEQALLAERTDEAERLTNAARILQPDNVRVAFLTAQIGKAREQAQSGAARSAAKGDLSDQPQLAARVGGLLRQAEERTRSGALIEPADNSARFFIDSAAALAPSDPGVRQARRELARALTAQARSALQAGRPDESEHWLDAAAESGAKAEELGALRRDAQNARATAKAEVMASTSQLFNQRLAQGRLLEPTDSARYYLAQLEAADPVHPSTALARQTLAARLIEEARGASGRKDSAAAREWLDQARKLGASAPDVAALEGNLDAAGAPQSSGVVPASQLVRVRYVEPQYPPVASQLGRSGTVDLEFTVRADGSVSDVNITQADPRGMFEASAVQAVSKWRYRPLERDGHPIDQRVRVRLRFALK